MAGGDDSLGVRDDGVVIEKHVDVVLGRQQGADVALRYEVRAVGALDGFGHLHVGGVDQIADLAAGGLLPIGQATDVGVNSWVGRQSHRGSIVVWRRALESLFGLLVVVLRAGTAVLTTTEPVEGCCGDRRRVVRGARRMPITLSGSNGRACRRRGQSQDVRSGLAAYAICAKRRS
jgi:hypothetical protein